MTLNADIKALSALGDKRNEKLYAWLRWLVLLAAGFFSLMVGQLAGQSFSQPQLLLLKLALSLNALGILCGSAALYGEVVSLRRLARHYKARIDKRLQAEDECVASEPVVGKPPAFLRASEWVCYVALMGSVVSWVAFIMLMR